MDKDAQEATRWYRKMEDCDLRDSTEEDPERAAAAEP